MGPTRFTAGTRSYFNHSTQKLLPTGSTIKSKDNYAKTRVRIFPQFTITFFSLLLLTVPSWYHSIFGHLHRLFSKQLLLCMGLLQKAEKPF